VTTGWIASEYHLRPEPFYLGVGFVAIGLALSADRAHGVLVNVGDSRAYRYRDGTLERLSRDVCDGLAREDIRGRTITVKLRLTPFRTRIRSQTLPQPTHDPEQVAALAHQLLGRFELDGAVRLIGVGVSSLEREGAAESNQSSPELALPI